MADPALSEPEKKRVVYLMVPRTLIVTLIIICTGLMVAILGSFVYSNYVAHQLCGVITISNNAYKLNPRPSETVKTLTKEFERLSRKYHC